MADSQAQLTPSLPASATAATATATDGEGASSSATPPLSETDAADTTSATTRANDGAAAATTVAARAAITAGSYNPLWGSLEPHAGWIRKRPVRKADGGTKERFLVLDGLTLSYYSDHSRRDIKGTIGINCTSSIRALDPTSDSTNTGSGGVVGGGLLQDQLGFVFTEFQHAGLRTPRQLVARVASKFDLDRWVQRISDAIDFCYLLANTAGGDGSGGGGGAAETGPLFGTSLVVRCELPVRHWKGECRLLLRGNLLWFEALDGGGSRSNSASSRGSGTAGHRRGRGHDARDRNDSTISGSATHEGAGAEALQCVSVSHTTRVQSVGELALALSSWLQAGGAAPTEKPVRITFLTAASKQRLANDLANIVKCTRAAMPSPPSGDLCVLLLCPPNDRPLTDHRRLAWFYRHFFPCRVFLPNYLGFMVFMVPRGGKEDVEHLGKLCHRLVQKVLARARRGKHRVSDSADLQQRRGGLFLTPHMEAFLASATNTRPRVTLLCNCTNVDTQRMVERLERLAGLPVESWEFCVSTRSPLHASAGQECLRPQRNLLHLWKGYATPALWKDTASQHTDDESDHELQLDVHEADAGAGARDALVVRVVKHVVCQDLKSREFVKYVVAGAMGGDALTWQVQRRYSDFRDLATQLELYQREHRLESVALPALPDSQVRKNSVDAAVIATRKQTLGHYLQELLAVPEWRGSPCFMQFIGMLSTARNQERRSVVHVSKLLDWCDVGDLIVFRTLNPLSAIQRFGTSSEWDHVGMVVVSPINNRRALLEATGEGVTCYPLVGRLRAYSHGYAERIGVRRLTRKDGDTGGGGGSAAAGGKKKKRVGTPRYVSAGQRAKMEADTGPASADVRRGLAEFAKRVNGKPYSLSAGKLLLLKESTRDPQKFFCSELVAEALKTVGLLNGDRVSASWWPRDFQDGGSIEAHLHPAWQLGEVRELDMETTSFRTQ